MRRATTGTLEEIARRSAVQGSLTALRDDGTPLAQQRHAGDEGGARLGARVRAWRPSPSTITTFTCIASCSESVGVAPRLRLFHNCLDQRRRSKGFGALCLRGQVWEGKMHPPCCAGARVQHMLCIVRRVGIRGVLLIFGDMILATLLAAWSLLCGGACGWEGKRRRTQRRTQLRTQRPRPPRRARTRRPATA